MIILGPGSGSGGHHRKKTGRIGGQVLTGEAPLPGLKYEPRETTIGNGSTTPITFEPADEPAGMIGLGTVEI